MTLRPIAASLAFAALLGLAGLACGQDQDEPARSEASAEGVGKTSEKASVPKGKTKKTASKTKTTETASTTDPTKLERATFGGGCFWCLEAVFERLPGVKTVISGYAGGNVPRPSYDMVCTGLTGHAEVVQITYNPEVITFDKLLKVFWASHDPTTLNSQGVDVGTQYRSIILYHNDEQKQAAQKSYQKLTADRVFADPIVTELIPLRVFYPAERYHQDYYRRHKQEEYCQSVIAPKLRKLNHLNLK